MRLTGLVVGTTLTLQLDGTPKLSVSDSRFASGSVGILMTSKWNKANWADSFSAAAQ